MKLIDTIILGNNLRDDNYKLKLIDDVYTMNREKLFTMINDNYFFKNKKEIELNCGKKSKYYFDIRKMFLSNNHTSLVLPKLLQILVFKNKFDDVNVIYGGLETGGLLVAMYLGLYTISDYFFIRKQRKEHGLNNLIEHAYKNDEEFLSKKIVIVDDVISSGKSIINVIDVLSKFGVKCSNMLSIFSIIDRREELGFDKVEFNGIPVVSMFDSKEFINYKKKK